MRYLVGSRVRLTGLKAAAEHNGKCGSVVGFQGERCKVKLVGDETTLAVKEANLEEVGGEDDERSRMECTCNDREDAITEEGMPADLELSEAYLKRYPSATVELDVRIAEFCELASMYCHQCGRLFVDAPINWSYWGIRTREDVDRWTQWEMEYIMTHADSITPETFDVALKQGWTMSVRNIQTMLTVARRLQEGESIDENEISELFTTM